MTTVGQRHKPSRRRTAGMIVTLAAVPWLWFVVRDRLGLLSDVLAITLPAVAVAAVVVTALVGLRWWPALAVATSVFLMGTAATVLPWIPERTAPVDRAGAVRIAEANIGAGELDGADALLGQRADVLVVSEIGPPLTARLALAYPSTASEWAGPAVGVFSRFPFTVLERPGPDLPGLIVRVDGPAGPFVLEALHVPRAWWRVGPNSYETTAGEHHRLVELAVARAAVEQLPVLIVGDLNTTDRGREYRDLLHEGRLFDAMRETWAAPTQVGEWRGLLVRIDHILIRDGWCADNSDRYLIPASDHLGTVATVGPCG
jgi:endonuclease/exonuclease/phosphatase (EEP) superfamily protein YafD